MYIPTRDSLSNDQRTTACVVDQDNLCHRGVDRLTGQRAPRAQLDVLGLAQALHDRGVVRGIICRNWDFPVFADQIWRGLGFDIAAVRSNCDARVVVSLICYVEAGFRDLILCAGDGDYTHAVNMIRRCENTRVEIWSRRGSTSKTLIQAANSVRYIDDLLTFPARPSVYEEA